MKCATHPETDAIGACVGCGTGVCAACRQTVDGRTYCRPCAERASAGGPTPPGPSLVGPSLLPRAQAPGAVTSLVLGIVGFVIWPIGLICGPLAINYANQARDAIAVNPLYDGSGMATAGYVLGIIDTIFGVLFVLYIIMMFTCAFVAFPF